MTTHVSSTPVNAFGVDAYQPRSAYIHVPFCRHRCGYCNFTLVAGRDDLVADYLQAVALELLCLEFPRQVDTLYFGGGTPTHLTLEQLRHLCKLVAKWHPLAAGYEWTVEANPADLDGPKIDTLRELGITRISLGGQSFRNEKLALLERDHTGADIHRAVELAREAGMQIAIDLIYATPGETLDQWLTDVETAIELEPDHISTYGLTFERGTAFWRRRQQGELRGLDEELELHMYSAAIDRLIAAGFEHYEVSNFARPGHRSRHNQTYWSGDGYFAAGPGAARYVDGIRETDHRSTTTYLRRVLAGDSPVFERECLPPEARAREVLVFSLRWLEGMSRRDFVNKTGFEADKLISQPLARFVEMGLLESEGDRIRLTRRGLFVGDAIWPELL